MIACMRDRLERTPFIPFLIRASDGHEYPVPSRDHPHISPRGNRGVIFLDKGLAVPLGSIHINGIVDQQPSGE
jgi:hypothetical protein